MWFIAAAASTAPDRRLDAIDASSPPRGGITPDARREIAIQAALEKKLAELEAERAAQREADRLADEAFTKEFLAAAMEVFRLLDTDESMSLDHDEFVSDSAWFPSISQLELRGDGVNAMPHRRDAVDVAVRESTRLVREPRQFRDAVVRHRWEASRTIPWSRIF